MLHADHRAIAWLLGLAAFLLSSPASAFCGFFVGSTQGLYNDATQVVLLRDGTHTVLSMRPDYKGPVQDFAMVIPVPQVLEKEDVRTLTAQPFVDADRLSAPRLVEYHEQDPCAHHHRKKPRRRGMSKKSSKGKGMASAIEDMAPPPKVRVKAQFTKAEYEIVILDADESAALEAWLNEHGYAQPPGAAKALAPYVQAGMYFFAAKVDVEKVYFDPEGKAVLSPIQFKYTSEDFQLPIRLGLLNAREEQDLIVFILAKDRYEAANRKNVFIPTNISVAAERKNDFAKWYEGLFRRTMQANPRAVVTEYVWAGTNPAAPMSPKCDPCPPGVPPVNAAELGGTLLGDKWNSRDLLVTRLHTRYGKKGTTSDIVFKPAKPVVGGREIRKNGKLEPTTVGGKVNQFQGRYAIRYKWRGKLTCDDPRYGIWSSGVSSVGVSMPIAPPGRPGRPVRRKKSATPVLE